MKIQVLKEDEPLTKIEVTFHIRRPKFHGEQEPKVVEFKQLQMKVFTDGEIARVGEEKIEPI